MSYIVQTKQGQGNDGRLHPVYEARRELICICCLELIAKGVHFTKQKHPQLQYGNKKIYPCCAKCYPFVEVDRSGPIETLLLSLPFKISLEATSLTPLALFTVHLTGTPFASRDELLIPEKGSHPTCLLKQSTRPASKKHTAGVPHRVPHAAREAGWRGHSVACSVTGARPSCSSWVIIS